MGETAVESNTGAVSLSVCRDPIDRSFGGLLQSLKGLLRNPILFITTASFVSSFRQEIMHFEGRYCLQNDPDGTQREPNATDTTKVKRRVQHNREIIGERCHGSRNSPTSRDRDADVSSSPVLGVSDL